MSQKDKTRGGGKDRKTREIGKEIRDRWKVMVNYSTFLSCHRVQFSDRLHVQGVRFTELTRVNLVCVSHDSVCPHCKWDEIGRPCPNLIMW